MKRLQELNKTQAEMAAVLGIEPSGVNRMIGGMRQLKGREPILVSDFLQVPLEYVMYGPPGEAIDPYVPTKNGKRGVNKTTAAEQSPYRLGGLAKDLPVRGRAVGGEDDWFEMNGQTLDIIERPSILTGSAEAYAVYVAGTSMVPRYMPGETLYVHPGKAVVPGCFVVVQIKPKADGEPPRALVKRFVREGGGILILSQFNPSKEIKLESSQILSKHRVVLGGDA
ncbi:MAG TPA: S24 family peptidase [Aliidongia sp.]|uniref:S24 family peptidase n=1 Tax=Aliidongia sp. TaxID=1914230 RepID=UPI002DDDA8D9|nr:S24 family peptidase [Aliidongia sp.]HEV2674113.1 S24 family peptidase [Aliidongia sp.]